MANQPLNKLTIQQGDTDYVFESVTDAVKFTPQILTDKEKSQVKSNLDIVDILVNDKYSVLHEGQFEDLFAAPTTVFEEKDATKFNNQDATIPSDTYTGPFSLNNPLENVNDVLLKSVSFKVYDTIKPTEIGMLTAGMPYGSMHVPLVTITPTADDLNKLTEFSLDGTDSRVEFLPAAESRIDPDTGLIRTPSAYTYLTALSTNGASFYLGGGDATTSGTTFYSSNGTLHDENLGIYFKTVKVTIPEGKFAIPELQEIQGSLDGKVSFAESQTLTYEEQTLARANIGAYRPSVTINNRRYESDAGNNVQIGNYATTLRLLDSRGSSYTDTVSSDGGLGIYFASGAFDISGGSSNILRIGLAMDDVYTPSSRLPLSAMILDPELAKKQNKLNAGTGITLTDESDGTVTIDSDGGGASLPTNDKYSVLNEGEFVDLFAAPPYTEEEAEPSVYKGQNATIKMNSTALQGPFALQEPLVPFANSHLKAVSFKVSDVVAPTIIGISPSKYLGNPGQARIARITPNVEDLNTLTEFLLDGTDNRVELNPFGEVTIDPDAGMYFIPDDVNYVVTIDSPEDGSFFYGGGDYLASGTSFSVTNDLSVQYENLGLYVTTVKRVYSEDKFAITHLQDIQEDIDSRISFTTEQTLTTAQKNLVKDNIGIEATPAISFNGNITTPDMTNTYYLSPANNMLRVFNSGASSEILYPVNPDGEYHYYLSGIEASQGVGGAINLTVNIEDTYDVESNLPISSKTIAPELAKKQDKLIAGDGISIDVDGKTISTTGGGAVLPTNDKYSVLNEGDFVDLFEEQQTIVVETDITKYEGQNATDSSNYLDLPATLKSPLVATENKLLKSISFKSSPALGLMRIGILTTGAFYGDMGYRLFDIQPDSDADIEEYLLDGTDSRVTFNPTNDMYVASLLDADSGLVKLPSGHLQFANDGASSWVYGGNVGGSGTSFYASNGVENDINLGIYIKSVEITAPTGKYVVPGIEELYNSGANYTAGDGISISSNTISAEVTGAEFDDIAAKTNGMNAVFPSMDGVYMMPASMDYVDEEIGTVMGYISEKQDKLIAGDGISIDADTETISTNLKTINGQSLVKTDTETNIAISGGTMNIDTSGDVSNMQNGVAYRVRIEEDNYDLTSLNMQYVSGVVNSAELWLEQAIRVYNYKGTVIFPPNIIWEGEPLSELEVGVYRFEVRNDMGNLIIRLKYSYVPTNICSPDGGINDIVGGDIIAGSCVTSGSSLFSSRNITSISGTWDNLTSGSNMYQSLGTLKTDNSSYPKLTSMTYMYMKCPNLSITGEMNYPLVTTASNAFNNSTSSPQTSNGKNHTIKPTSVSFPELVNGNNLFNGCRQFSPSTVNFPKLQDGRVAFLGTSGWTYTGILDFPALTQSSFMFFRYAPTSPDAYEINGNFNPSRINLPELIDMGPGMFRGCLTMKQTQIYAPKLSTMSDSVFSGSSSSNRVNLDLAALQFFVNNLPTYTRDGTHVLYIGGMNAASAVTAEANAKGWEIGNIVYTD